MSAFLTYRRRAIDVRQHAARADGAAPRRDRCVVVAEGLPQRVLEVCCDFAFRRYTNPSTPQASAVSANAIRPRRAAKSPRSPRRTASSIERARHHGAASPVGQPKKNTGIVTYPSRPSGRTALAALTSSAAARSNG